MDVSDFFSTLWTAESVVTRLGFLLWLVVFGFLGVVGLWDLASVWRDRHEK